MPLNWGQSSLRGWSTTNDYDEEGKLIYDLMNLEYRIHIYKKLGGILFIDAGRLYDNIADYNNIDINWDYGFGVTYDTAFGPARIEYAIPYVRSTNYQHAVHDINESGKIHVSLLYMF